MLRIYETWVIFRAIYTRLDETLTDVSLTRVVEEDEVIVGALAGVEQEHEDKQQADQHQHCNRYIRIYVLCNLT